MPEIMLVYSKMSTVLDSLNVRLHKKDSEIRSAQNYFSPGLHCSNITWLKNFIHHDFFFLFSRMKEWMWLMPWSLDPLKMETWSSNRYAMVMDRRHISKWRSFQEITKNLHLYSSFRRLSTRSTKTLPLHNMISIVLLFSSLRHSNKFRSIL